MDPPASNSADGDQSANGSSAQDQSATSSAAQAGTASSVLVVGVAVAACLFAVIIVAFALFISTRKRRLRKITVDAPHLSTKRTVSMFTISAGSDARAGFPARTSSSVEGRANDRSIEKPFERWLEATNQELETVPHKPRRSNTSESKKGSAMHQRTRTSSTRDSWTPFDEGMDAEPDALYVQLEDDVGAEILITNDKGEDRLYQNDEYAISNVDLGASPRQATEDLEKLYGAMPISRHTSLISVNMNENLHSSPRIRPKKDGGNEDEFKRLTLGLTNSFMDDLNQFALSSNS